MTRSPTTITNSMGGGRVSGRIINRFHGATKDLLSLAFASGVYFLVVLNVVITIFKETVKRNVFFTLEDLA